MIEVKATIYITARDDWDADLILQAIAQLSKGVDLPLVTVLEQGRQKVEP